MPMEKDAVREERPATVEQQASGNDFHRDGEMGLGTVDIERIEQVYR